LNAGVRSSATNALHRWPARANPQGPRSSKFTEIQIKPEQIDSSPPPGERKTVTALLADIKGSMELIEDLDPEEARAILDPALTLNRTWGLVLLRC
jgi:hypothetical protein